MSTSLDIGNSSLDAAIFDFPFLVKSYNISSIFIGLVDLKNIDLVFQIRFYVAYKLLFTAATISLG